MNFSSREKSQKRIKKWKKNENERNTKEIQLRKREIQKKEGVQPEKTISVASTQWTSFPLSSARQQEKIINQPIDHNHNDIKILNQCKKGKQ